MGYPSPLKAVSRKLTENIVITSGAFSRFDKINFGFRMALIKVGNDVVVWSAIPYGTEVERAFKLFDKTLNVSHLIIPDVEHTLAAVSFKEKFPQVKILAPSPVDLALAPTDYKFSDEYSNRKLAKSDLIELGIKEATILDNFEFVYLPKHGNKELVMYDTLLKILFEADLLFNLGTRDPLEQYSAATGYSDGYWAHSGWSFLTRYLQPYSKVGNFIFNKLADSNNPDAANGLKAIYSWDFETIVLCHGNVITSKAKDAFLNLFRKAIS